MHGTPHALKETPTTLPQAGPLLSRTVRASNLHHRKTLLTFHSVYPGFTGARPKMQIYHGSADATLRPANYQETMKEWSGVFGYNYDKPQSTQANTPQSGYTKTTYGASVEGIYAQNVGHTVPIRGADDMKFFGFA